MGIRRVFLIVLDSLGVGAMPDAHLFGDEGSNTLRSIAKSAQFHIPNLLSLGLSQIEGIDFLPNNTAPKAAVCRLAEASLGKDTTVGHWEMMGLISEKPFPTFPEGFPLEVISAFEQATGRGVLCNKPYSGTKVIEDYGQQHLKTGDYIVYTSADSVFQIAAHEEKVPIAQLYEDCQKARNILTGDNAVARVIARPFIGKYPHFERTANRHDFSLSPWADTVLDILMQHGLDTISVGKINDIFAGQGISKSIPTKNNNYGMAETMQFLNTAFEGLAFTNLVDFDMKYGHRNDVDGYAKALSDFDEWLGEFLPKMKKDDVLFITADHGCDPGTESTDHSREYVPFLAYGHSIKPGEFGTRKTFADIGKTICDIFKIQNTFPGESFYHTIF